MALLRVKVKFLGMPLVFIVNLGMVESVQVYKTLFLLSRILAEKAELGCKDLGLMKFGIVNTKFGGSLVESLLAHPCLIVIVFPETEHLMAVSSKPVWLEMH